MAGWDTIQGLLSGVPTLIKDDLWQEVREATWERASAQVLGAPPLIYPYDEYFAAAIPPRGQPRDPIGKITAHRSAFLSLLGGISCFYKETDAGEWPPQYAAAENLPWQVNVFSEAGLPGGSWTLPGPAVERTLPRKALWTDFLALLNLLVFSRLSSALISQSASCADYEEGRYIEKDLSWVDTRAAAWASIPIEGGGGAGSWLVGRKGVGAYDYYPPDPPYGFRCWTVWHEWVQVAIDLSPLRDVTHLNLHQAETIGTGDGTTGPYAFQLDHPHVVPGSLVIRTGKTDTDPGQRVTDDGAGNLTGDGTGTINYSDGAGSVTFTTAVPIDDPILAEEYEATSRCPPLRLVFYLTYEPQMAEGLSDMTESVDFKIRLSGDGGSTWEELGQFTSIIDGEPHTLKLISTDASRWTANSILRIEHVGNKNSDTPNWTALPYGAAPHYNTYYAAAVGFALSSKTFGVFCEFDWDYQA